MMRLGKFWGCALLLLSVHGAADARRTAIDSDGTNTTSTTVGGYCDYNGEDCSPTSLGYTVDFGQGPLSSIIIYGNGIISFGNTPIDTSLLSSNLADYGLPAVSPGINNNVENDFQGSQTDVFSQSAKLQVGPGGKILANFFTCVTPQFCNERPYGAVLTPTSGGYQVSFNYAPNAPFLEGSGFFLPPSTQTTFNQIASRSFLLPASFSGLAPSSALPEPATWLMMLLGFILIGSAIRSQPRLLRPA